MGLDFEEISRNIVVIDASENADLREDPRALMDTMAYAIREKKTNNVVIDSITGLYEHKEMMARQIVRQFFNFLKNEDKHQYSSLKRDQPKEQNTAEAAGGLAVAHIVDGSIVMDKKLIESKWETSTYNLPIGSVLRTIRIDGCRLTGHDTRTWVFDITEGGTIEIISPLKIS